MKMNAYVVMVYGLFIFVGGLMGYAMANSIPSLVMGSLAALFVIGCGISMLQGKRPAQVGAFVAALVLCSFFCYRFLRTGMVFPAAPMVAASLATSAFLGFKWRN
jgi:uncharacterized membrane protein (UPF0136 family)